TLARAAMKVLNSGDYNDPSLLYTCSAATNESSASSGYGHSPIIASLDVVSNNSPENVISPIYPQNRLETLEGGMDGTWNLPVSSPVPVRGVTACGLCFTPFPVLETDEVGWLMSLDQYHQLDHIGS